MMVDTIPGVGTGVGAVFGVIGLIMLVIGIVLVVSSNKDKKWADEINARNAAQGIGGAQFNGYQQQPGGAQFNGYQQQMPGAGDRPLNGYQQPEQQGTANEYSSNPYQQNNQNM